MKVDNISSNNYQLYMQKLKEEQQSSQNTDVASSMQQTQMPFYSQDMDMYIPSEQSSETQTGIPSQQYNDMRPPMPPMAPPEETSETEATTLLTDSEETSESSSILSTISEVMRVNTDSIEAAMEELGISKEDLTDEDSLTELLDALASGATERGLGTASESEIASLISQLTAATESSETTTEEAESTDL